MDGDELIEGLEAEAARILAKLDGSERPRPLFVEFSGTPKAGKSTIINSLRLFLARNKFKAFVLTERASTCPIRDKKDPFFNVWTACATLTQMLSASQGKDDVVIMDRGLFDALAWMTWLEDTSRLSSEERRIVRDFITMKRWLDMIDLVFVMRVSPEEALKREFGGQVTQRPGSIMNETTIGQFNEALSRTFESFDGSRFLHVDTTAQEAQDTAYDVVKKTLDALDKTVG